MSMEKAGRSMIEAVKEYIRLHNWPMMYCDTDSIIILRNGKTEELTWEQIFNEFSTEWHTKLEELRNIIRAYSNKELLSAHIVSKWTINEAYGDQKKLSPKIQMLHKLIEEEISRRNLRGL